MEREDTLNAHTAGNLTHGKGRTQGAVHTLDADSLKDLDTLLVALDNLDVNPQGISSFKSRNVLLHLFHFQTINNVHIFLLSNELLCSAFIV